MVKRCRWVSDSKDEKMVAYHDQEFGRPVFDDDRLLFELLTLELFQSGLSWKTVLNKRENFKRAFADFDVKKVAAFTGEDVDRLLADSGIIRNRMKIDATINNAKQIQRLQNEGKIFSEIVWQPTDGQTLQVGVGANEHVPSQTDLSVNFSKQLKKFGFKFVGPVTMESFLEAVGVENAHDLDCAFR